MNVTEDTLQNRIIMAAIMLQAVWAGIEKETAQLMAIRMDRAGRSGFGRFDCGDTVSAAIIVVTGAWRNIKRLPRLSSTGWIAAAIYSKVAFRSHIFPLDN